VIIRYILTNVTAKEAIQHKSALNRGPAEQKGSNMLIYVIRFLRTWRNCSFILEELNRLSDDQLKELGITRSEIPRIAWEQATA
jgi:uncharacterized protein YjiS (DUF1127 family)